MENNQALKTSSFAGVRIWRRSRKNRPDRWLNCRVVLTIYNKRTITCGLVWKRIGVKTHEGAATLHHRLRKIKARSLSGQTTVTQQWTTSYPLVALRFLICYPERTTWRLNQERGPCVVPAVQLVACLAEYKDKSAERGDSRSKPLKIRPRGTGAKHHHFYSCILPSGLHQSRTCFHPQLSGDLKTCYPPRWANTS